MRVVKVLCLAAGLLLAAVPVWAACPTLGGLFTTTDGTLQSGRASEAWCGADGAPVGPGVPGNTENAMSWDGAALGAQWKVWGMAIDAAGAVLVGSRTLGSYMYVDYATDYDGGQFWLSRDYAWADGLADLGGVVSSYHVTTTVTLYNSVPVVQTSSITMTGVFTDCPELNGCVVEFAIANAVKVWDSTKTTPKPANYPPFLCDATAGELFDACCVQLSINCAVAQEQESWGGLKAMYR